MLRIFIVFTAAVAALVAAAAPANAKTRKSAHVVHHVAIVPARTCPYGISITGACAAPPTLCQQGLTATGTCTPQAACSEGRTASGQCVNPLLAAIMTQRAIVFTQPKFSRSGGSVVPLPHVWGPWVPFDTIETQRTGEP